jgi:Zn2+/Cd2+-exporting ATPase
MLTLPHLKPDHRSRLRLQFSDSFVEPLFVVLTLIGIVAGGLLQRADVAPGLLLAVQIATYGFGSFYAVRAIIAASREWKIQVDLLMVLAALGAAYVGAWIEGAILLFLFALSNVLQNYAMRRTEQAITALVELRPDTVLVRNGELLTEQHIEAVQVGAVVVLRPGDRAPLDGIILSGQAAFDEATLTGEALPVQKGPGDVILAGTLNINGALDVQVTKPLAESTLTRIIEMVSAAQARKARTQSFLDRAEQYYAMGVIGAVALFITLLPLLFGRPFAETFYTGMVLLTVASPCALVISVPAALLSAIANAARRGVLFKGGAHLEELSRVKVIAFDKTGTLTYGKPAVADVLPADGVSADELLLVVARAEAPSEHPIARAIAAYATAQGLTIAEPEQFDAITGMGVRATWDGVATLVGAPRLFTHTGAAVPDAFLAEGDRLGREGRGTVLYARRGERWLGLITVADSVRPEAAARIAELRAVGIERVVMLTGDSERVAEGVARQLGIDDVYAGLMPEDKLRIVGELQQRYGPVAMVGDGVNDAPALAAATIGIAMGAAGTDAALETADVVLMSDDLGGIAYAVGLSKRSQRIVWQNITFAMAVVVILVIATLSIGIALPLGVVGHEGSTIIVVLNGLRLLAHRGG